jgi:uncharacterized membrane protein required for colicin V production
MTWADGLLALTLAVAFWGGYRSGVVREAVGMLAIILAWVLAGAFAGTMGPTFETHFGLSTASAHLVAFWLLFLFVFGAARAFGWVLERMTAQPVLRVASGIGGGFVACAKAVLALWLILFIALFFPIAPDVRATLARSPGVVAIEALDKPAYAMLSEALPRRTRPLVRLFLDRHHL